MNKYNIGDIVGINDEIELNEYEVIGIQKIFDGILYTIKPIKEIKFVSDMNVEQHKLVKVDKT